MGLPVRLQIDGPRDSDAVLWDWLTGVPELRGHLHQEPATPRAEELGAGADLLINLTAGLVSGALVTALQVWLTDRASSRSIQQTTITVTAPDGHAVSLTTTDPAAGARALRDLLAPQTPPGLEAPGDQSSDQV